MTNSKQQASYRILFFLFAVVYFVISFQNLPDVFSSAGIVLPGTDPYYRMHRIVNIVHGSWKYPLFDPLLNFPVGWNVAWPLGLDYLLALPSKIFGIYDEPNIMIVASMMIPILTFIFPFLIIAFVTKKTNPWVGLIAGVCILCTTIPYYSGVGQIDHHIFDALFIFSGFCLTSRLRTSNRGSDQILFVLLCGLSPSISPHGWLVGAMIAITVLFANYRFQRKISGLLFCSFLLSLIAIFLSDRFWNGSVSMAGFSWWSSYILISASLVIRIGACLGQKKIFKLDIVIFVLFFILTLFLSIRSGFFIWNQLSSSLNWLLNHADGTLSQTVESQSAFSTIAQHSEDIWFLYVSPLVICWFIFKKKQLELVVYLVIFSILSFIQIRFLLIAMPFIVVGLMLSIFEFASSVFRPKYSMVVTLMVVLGIGFPRFGFSSMSIVDKGFFSVRQSSRFIRQLVLEEHVDRTKSGVIAPWDFGHWIVFYANLPVVASPFQEPSALEIEKLFASENPTDMDVFLQKYPAKFVMLDESFPHFWATLKHAGKMLDEYFDQTENNSEIKFTTKQKFENVFYYRYLHRLGEDPDGNASRHWRLVHVSPLSSKYSYGLSALKTYEYVPGVNVRMISNVQDLWIETNVYEEKDHVNHVCRQKSIVEKGTHHWQVPYAAYARQGVVASGIYKIVNSTDKIIATLPTIREDQVVRGDTMDVKSQNP